VGVSILIYFIAESSSLQLASLEAKNYCLSTGVGETERGQSMSAVLKLQFHGAPTKNLNHEGKGSASLHLSLIYIKLEEDGTCQKGLMHSGPCGLVRAH
jgi:hypothetical protein